MYWQSRQESTKAFEVDWGAIKERKKNIRQIPVKVHHWAEFPGVVSNRKLSPNSLSIKHSYYPITQQYPDALCQGLKLWGLETEETAGWLKYWQPWPAASCHAEGFQLVCPLTSSLVVFWPVVGWQNRKSFSHFDIATSDSCVNAEKCQQNLL